MRKLLVTSIFVLIFCVAMFSQTNETLLYPTIEVIIPTGITIVGETMTSTANARGNNNNSLTYN